MWTIQTVIDCAAIFALASALAFPFFPSKDFFCIMNPSLPGNRFASHFTHTHTLLATYHLCSTPCPRLPSPQMDFPSCDGYSNESGLCAVLMRDLQRVLACICANGDDVRDPNMIPYFIAVAKGSFSSSIVLPMSANSEWRPAVWASDFVWSCN